MRKTKLSQFLDWLTDHSPANWGQIKEAGFKSVFTGQTRQKLVSLGIVLVEKTVIDDAQAGQHRHLNLYSMSGKPYQRKQPGRRAGYRLDSSARKNMMVRGAITTLMRYGYHIVPPEANENG